jgi:hypothetical protein
MPTPLTPSIGRHLATFNVFREADHSLHVTIADARGVREELGESGAPLHLCAMNALRAAEEIREPYSPEIIKALRDLFEACRHHDPDDWKGEPAMCAAYAVLEAIDKGPVDG